MIVYKDLLSGDELFTDTCIPVLSNCKLYYTFASKMIENKVGDIDGALIGANASAEEQAEQCETSVESGLDFAINSKLEKFDYGSKKIFQSALKEFFKREKAKIAPEDLATFEANAKNFCMKLLTNYNDIDFFFGASDDEKKNTFCAALWNPDGVSATVYVYAGSIEAVKY